MIVRDPILLEREKTHGVFVNNATMWDALCKAIPSDSPMTPGQRLAIMMIFVKIARAHEQPNVLDHWKDIAGYANLGAEGCE